MKGQIGLLLVAVVASLIIGGVFFNVFSTSSTEVLIAAREKDILVAIDKLEILKRGLPYMLNYSFYQAAYEVATNGGYLDSSEYEKLTNKKLDGKPYWRVYDKTYFPNYIDALKKRTRDIINEYVSSVSELGLEYNIIDVLVFYREKEPYKVELIVEPYKAELIANSSRPMSYSGRDFVIYDNPNVTLNLDLTFFKMFELAKEKFVDIDSIKEAIVESEPEDMCKHTNIGDVCEYNIDPESWLNNNCPYIDETFKQNIESKIKSLGRSNQFCSISLEPLEVVVGHISSYVYESKQENFDRCGCKQWGNWVNTSHKEETNDACKSYCKGQGYDDGSLDNKSGDCLCRSCEKAYEMYYGVNYTYEYKGAAKVKVNITSKENFPTQIDKIILNFYLVSSNDYIYNPI